MKRPYARILALVLTLAMLLSVFPAAALAVEQDSPAPFMSGLPEDGSSGVLYQLSGVVMGADLPGNGKAPAIAANADDSGITALPNGTAVLKFIKADETNYYLTIGGKYLVIKDLSDSKKEQIVLTASIEPGAKWLLLPAQDGAAGWYNLKNAEYQYNNQGNLQDVYLEYYNGNITAYSYKANNADAYKFKFAATEADEDGRVGEVGGMFDPEKTYAIYNALGEAVFGQPTPADQKANLLPAAASPANDALAYEDIADGGLLFTVTSDGPYYVFKTRNGGETDLYLAMTENYQENGSTRNDESLILIEDGSSEYARWKIDPMTGGYKMTNKAAQWGSSAVVAEYFDGGFCGYSYYSDQPEKYAMTFYEVPDQDGKGYVVNPAVTFTALEPAIGRDCEVTFKINDVSDPVSVSASYSIQGENPSSNELTPEISIRTGSFTIPAAALEGNTTLSINVSVTDANGKTFFAAANAEIQDEPLLLEVSPAPNSATGEDKRPEISVRYANVKDGATFVMTLDGEAVAAGAEEGKLAYTPAEDLSNGKHNVTVTVTRADGKHAEKLWSFFVGESGEALYFGQIHSHTAEYSDGAGTLEDAYEHASGVADMDFIIVTDHSNYFDTTATATTSSYYDLSSLLNNAAGTTTKWEEARATSKAYNETFGGAFLCLYGYEMTWSGGPGHTNTFNTYGVVSRNNAELNNKTGYAGMHRYNDLMVNAEQGLDVEGNEAKTTRDGAEVSGVNATKYIPYDAEGQAVPVVSQFNHPGKTFGNFDNFAGYTAKRDDVLNLVEVGNGEGKVGGSSYFPSYEEYDLCLSMGWHVAPTNNQDNHKGNWGDSNTCRDVVLTDDFSEIGIYRALDARRVYATEDQNLEVYYELEANGQRYKLGDIAPIEEDEQPDSVTAHITVVDPNGEKLSSVEIIGEGAKTLWKQENIDANNFQQDVTIPNTDGYYYIRVVEADGDIAVTAPVWVKEAIPVAADLETSASVAAQGEEETVTATLTNGSESEILHLKGVKIEAEGQVILESTGLEIEIQPGQEQVCSVPFTPALTEPAATKTYEITVTFNAVFKGKELTYTKTISETSYPPSMMTYIGLDKGHDNFYVSGDYAGNEGNFIQICAQRGIICQYIDKGQMTKENLAKYKAVVITVPRAKGDALPALWTAEELEALADYTANGGSILNFSKSDRYDPDDLVDGQDSYKYASATLSNAINEAIGAKTRFVRGIVVDNERKANEAYRIYFNGRDLVGDHLFTEGIYPTSNGQYQWYNGTGITIDQTVGFTDIKAGSWYAEAAAFALEHGIMTGTSTTTFAPNAKLTREQFVTILWAMSGKPASGAENPFTDVKAGKWYTNAVLWAYENGITGGVSADKFGVGQSVTREQLSLFLMKYAALRGAVLEGTNDLSAYPDKDQVSGWAQEAVKWAVGNGLISGVESEGTVYLSPKSPSTRAQIAVILRNFTQLAEIDLPYGENAAMPLIAPYDTTWVASYKANFTGSSYEPDITTDVVMADMGTFALATAEPLSGGGFLVCSGATFISNYDLKYGVAANQQYENYGLVCNILDFIKNGRFEGEVTPIAQVHQGQEGQEFTIEGIVTSNASDYDKDTAFFDCIYIQDETRGINAFPVSGYFCIGERVRAHGAVTYYCGEIELNLSPDYNGSIQVISNDLTPLEPTAVTCAEAMSDDNIGNLMAISGTITEIHETAGVIDKIYVDDGSGEEALLFINAYIQKESNTLDHAEVGMKVDGIGIGSRDVNEDSGGADGQVGDISPEDIIKRLRVRSRDEILVYAAELDTSELEAAIAQAQGLDRGRYTPESLAVLDEALEAALAVMADEDKDQRAVTQALNALLAALEALEEKTDHELYTPVTELKEGDVVVIYNPGHERAVKNGNYRDWYMLASTVTFSAENPEAIQDPAEDLLWTVHIDAEGNYSFSNGDNKIVMWGSQSGDRYYAEVTNNAAHEGADPLWNLTYDMAEDLYYFSSKTVVNGEKKGCLECYDKTVDGVKEPYMVGFFADEPGAKDFGFRFYTKAQSSDFALTTVLQEGDQVVIYHPDSQNALGNTLTGNKITPVAVTPNDGVLQPAEGVAIYTVEYAPGDTTNFYLKQEDGTYLTTFATGNGMSLEITPNDYSLWYLEVKSAEDNTVFVRSTNAAHNGNKNQALEYYSGFTTYGWKDTAAYTFQLFARAGAPAPAPGLKVGLIADYGEIEDKSYNQAAYESARDWCGANRADFACYQPADDTTADRITCIEQAITEGCDVLLLPGFGFAEAIVETAADHPEVKYIALDISEGDLEAANGEPWTLPANLYAAIYKEEQAGFLAGYAAVKLGYHKLGFLGGMPVPAVVRYGYGFVQGADAAAKELNAVSDVEVKFVYGNQFYGDATITTFMNNWYEAGTQAVFACGGGIYTSAAEAAAQHSGKVIGVDVDQAASIDEMYGAGITLTSAMKGLGATIGAQLDKIQTNTFVGGKVETLGVDSEDPARSFVQLPNSTQWAEGKFTQTDYVALVGALFREELTVSDDTENQPAVEITVDYQNIDD